MAPLDCSAVIFRGYRSALERRGLLERVREVVPPATRSLLERPPLSVSWVTYAAMNDVFVALEKVATVEQVRALGHEAARETVGPVLRPVIRGTLALFGGTPDGLFGNLNRIVGVVLRSTQFSWRKIGDGAGAVTIENPQPMSPMHYTGWEGAFLFGFEVLDVKGEVGAAEVRDDKTAARVELKWG